MSQYRTGKAHVTAGVSAAYALYDVSVTSYAVGPGGHLVLGEMLTVSNGASMRMMQAYSGPATGNLRAIKVGGTQPGQGHTVTGQTSGATFTIVGCLRDSDWFANVAVTGLGPIFSPGTSNWFAYVTAVAADGATLTLDRAWSDATLWDSDYVIQSSFSPILGLPLIGQGDYRTAALVNRANLDIDRMLGFSPLSIKTSNYTLKRSDVRSIVVVNTTGGAINLTLPLPATVGAGWGFRAFNIHAGAWNLVRSGSEQINGVAATFAMPAATYNGSHRVIFTDGTNWYVI